MKTLLGNMILWRTSE